MSTPEARKRAQERFRERHPEYRAEAMRRYRERNPEKAREHTQRYASQPEVKAAKAARARAWRAANPDKVRAYARDYQRRREAATVGDRAEIESWMRVLEGDPCAYCGAPGGEIDHIIAIAKGGTHSIDNLTSACRSCNSSKQTTDLLTFLARRSAQNNTLVVTANPVFVSLLGARLDTEHITAMQQRNRAGGVA